MQIPGFFFIVVDGDNLDNMEGVSLQAVTLSDGSTAYIQHNSKGISRRALLQFI